MSTLPSSITSALHAANIGFTGGTWLRLKGDGLDAISVNATSGGWIDHRASDHGNFHALAEKLGIDDSGVYIPRQSSSDCQQDAADSQSKRKQFARTHWARGIPAVKPARQKGWSLAAWDADQAQYQDARDAIYNYLASRGLDPLPLLPIIRIQPQLTSKGMDAEMQDAGADFAFLLPMFEIGKPQIAGNICGIQRTYLKFAEDKYHPVAKIGRRMLGKKGVTEIKGNSDPIALPTDQRVLGAGEGFETVASFVQVTGHGGLITWDWSGLKNWSKNISIKENAPLIAFLVDADTSQTGQRESAAALRRITNQEHGKAIYLLPPESIQPDTKGNRDWNDLLQQSPDDFAAEIVNAWHQSDDNLALAPVAPDTDAPVVLDYAGPKDAEVRQAIADAVARHAASEAMKKGIADYEAAYSAFRVLLAEWSALTPEERKAKGLKKPKLPPMLIKVTTGVGKTHQIRDLLQNSKQPLLILTPTHALAAEYSKAGAYPYHGRSEPAVKTENYTFDFVEKNQHQFGASDCFKYSLVKITSENNHVPALTACRSCEHGRKFIIDNYSEKSDAYMDAQDWFSGNNVDPNTVPACLWLSHQMEASHARIVVAPNASYSETLATWQTPDGPTPRLVIVDEMPDLTREIAAHSGDMGNNVENAQKAIKYLQDHREDGDEEVTAAIIADLEAAIDLFASVAEWMSGSLKQGNKQIPDDIVDQAKKLHVDWLPGATARWEKAVIRYGHDPFIPLRMMKAMIESVGTGTASTQKGILHVREVTALGEYISKGKPCILLDATPSRAVETLVMDKDGKIVQAIAKQHINLVHYHQYLHGRTWKNKEHQAEEMARLLVMREQMQAETGNTPNVLTYMPLCALAGTKDDAAWGYFGRDDIGQDRWKAQDLLICGGPLFGPNTQAIAYNAELMLMRLAGIKNLPDWSPDIERRQEITVGDKIVESKAPLPTDPALRDWVLADYGRRVAQGIGRVRGVWAPEDKPINVWIDGGLPLAGLAEHGITVNEYRQEKTIDLRDEAHKRAVEKVQIAMASLQAADQDPTYRAVNKWLADHALPSVQYKTWESVTKLSIGLNNNTYEPIDSLLASLESLQKVADWNGQDISDLALNTWDVPGIDPEIQIAAEIILEVSPYTDKWRQAQRDG